MKGIYLLLGGNLGDRVANLAQARMLLEDKGIAVAEASAIYATAAWGVEDQPGFLNQVLKVQTDQSAERLLTTVLNIEQEMGRVRMEKWGERLIDIDILYYQNQVMESDTLKVPHPEIPNRRFTLVPLAELAGEEKHPTLKKTQQQLLDICPDALEVLRFK